MMTLQSSAPPEHSSLCLSDVCARSLHDVQDSEMCTNPFHQEGLVGWEGSRKGDRPKLKCSAKQNQTMGAGSAVREGSHRVRQNKGKVEIRDTCSTPSLCERG